MARPWGQRRGLVQLVLTRYREFFREPEALFWTYGFPLLLATGLGIAFRQRPPERPGIGLATWSRDPAVAEAALRQDSGFAVTSFRDSAAAALALRQGRIALLVLPSDSGYRYRFDPARPEAAAARLAVDAALQRAAGRADVVPVRDDAVREPGSRYIDFLLPGLVGLNLMGSGIWGIGFSIVDARRRKLLKRLRATPMSRADYLASFVLAQLSLLVLEVGSILLFGTLAFGVPIRGSLGSLALVCVLASLAFGALGLLAAARPKTIEGASGMMNLIMLPMWVLSGVFFSTSYFPDTVQPLIQALPLTATLDALRALMLDGAPLTAVAGELGVLSVWVALSFGLALRLFRWR